jgi:hypothetical protein
MIEPGPHIRILTRPRRVSLLPHRCWFTHSITGSKMAHRLIAMYAMPPRGQSGAPPPSSSPPPPPPQEPALQAGEEDEEDDEF